MNKSAIILNPTEREIIVNELPKQEVIIQAPNKTEVNIQDPFYAVSAIANEMIAGKSVIANAITAKDVPTSPDLSYQQMAENIGNITKLTETESVQLLQQELETAEQDRDNYQSELAEVVQERDEYRNNLDNTLNDLADTTQELNETKQQRDGYKDELDIAHNEIATLETQVRGIDATLTVGDPRGYIREMTTFWESRFKAVMVVWYMNNEEDVAITAGSYAVIPQRDGTYVRLHDTNGTTYSWNYLWVEKRIYFFYDYEKPDAAIPGNILSAWCIKPFNNVTCGSTPRCILLYVEACEKFSTYRGSGQLYIGGMHTNDVNLVTSSSVVAAYIELVEHRLGVIFYNNQSLQSVELPALQTISGGSNIFSSNQSLQSVELPALQTISGGSGIFSSNQSLQSVELPALQTISGGSNIFYNNQSLQSVELPALQTISGGSGIFSSNQSLQSVELPALEEITLGGSSQVIISSNKDMTIRIPNLKSFQVTHQYQALVSGNFHSIYIGNKVEVATLRIYNNNFYNTQTDCIVELEQGYHGSSLYVNKLRGLTVENIKEYILKRLQKDVTDITEYSPTVYFYTNTYTALQTDTEAAQLMEELVNGGWTFTSAT